MLHSKMVGYLTSVQEPTHEGGVQWKFCFLSQESITQPHKHIPLHSQLQHLAVVPKTHFF